MMMRLFSVLCLIFSLWFYINVTEAVETYSVWNTKSETSQFCTHIRFKNSIQYQQWFNDLCDVAVQQTFTLSDLRLTNIYIVNPPILHCAFSSIDMMVETWYDSPEVRLGIQLYALRVKERTQEDINVHFLVHPVGTLFEPRDTDHCRYIIRHQLLVRNRLGGNLVFPPDYRDALCQIAQETNVLLNDMWLLNGRIQVTLLLANAVPTLNIRQFLEQAQRTLEIPIEIVQT